MSILKKFGRAIISGICMFIIMSVMYKLFMNNEEWLMDSIIWSVTWFAGHFLARCFTEGGSNDADVRIMYNIGAIFVAFIITAFICGIILNMENWGPMVAKVMLPFGLASYTNSK